VNFSQALQHLLENHSLSQLEMHDSMMEIMKGIVSPIQLASFLTALRMKGEMVDELAGAAQAMRETALPLSFHGPVLVDTCGTGGDAQGSWNISTAAAFVVAGAGYPVAKHGNRSISSRSGSADVLESLGISIETTPVEALSQLEKNGITFLYAPFYHPAMKHAMVVRKELATRTIFNLLGPLSNPAKPNVQIVGVFAERWVEPFAHVLARLGCRYGAVVHGAGHDEIILSGTTTVAEIVNGEIHTTHWKPEDFGITPQSQLLPKGGTPAENAERIRQVLKGQLGIDRIAVCVNAAAAIRSAYRQTHGTKHALTLRDAYQMAEKSIDGKNALHKLETLQRD